MALFNIIPNCIKAVSLSTSETYNALRPYNSAIVLGINDVGYPSGWWNGRTPPGSGYTVYIPNSPSSSTISTRIANNNYDLISIASYVSNTTITNIYDAFVSLIVNYNCLVMNYNLPNFPTIGLECFLLAGFSQSFPEAFNGATKIWWSSNDASITSPTKNYFNAVDNITMDSVITAISFNSFSQYLTINDSTNIPISNSSYTLACFFNMNNLNNYDLIGYGNFSTDNQANSLTITSNGEIENFWGTNNLTTSGLNLQTDTWYCAICTYNASTNTRTIYLDGNSVAQDNPSGSHNVTTASNTKIGYNATSGSSLFYGLIFNAGIYNVAFTPQNASDYYQAIYPLIANSIRLFNLLVNPTGSIATTQSIENINIQH
jgi:hypothetical protein